MAFVVNSFSLGRIMVESDARRAAKASVHHFLLLSAPSDVVLHPRQSFDLSSRGTTSPGPAGHSVGWTWCFTPVKALIFRRRAPRHRGGRAFCRLDVVLHPLQSLDFSLRGTTSFALAGPLTSQTWCFTTTEALILRRGAPRRRHPAGPSGEHQKRAAVDFSKRPLSSIHNFNTFSSCYTNIVTNGMVNRDSRVVSA